MSTLLHQFSSGKIFSEEQYRPFIEEYKKMQKEHRQHYADFIQKLSSPLDEEFIKIMDEQFDIFFKMFSDGLNLGAKIITKTYNSEGEKIINGQINN